MTRRKGKIMKVFELIEKLKKCVPCADVAFGLSDENPEDSRDIRSVLEIRYHEDADVNPLVVLRG